MVKQYPLQHAARIPRGTCKLFGAIKALGTIKNSVILVHGPKGCVYHINYILGMRGDRPSEIYSTCLDEHDVIFGAEQKLREAIEELDRSLHPDLVFVLSCCASDIIGEDAGSAVRNSNTRARVITMSAGGFEGDFREGYSETLCQLVKELVKKTDKRDPRSVNLIGMLRSGPDLGELRSMLHMIGVKVNAVLTADATLKDIERIGAASLNIVLCEPAGKEAAELLLSKCSIPFIIEELPIGYHSGIRLLERVAENLNLQKTSVLTKEEPILPDYSQLRDRRIAIVSGPTRAVSLIRFFMQHGIVPRLVIVDFACQGTEKIESLVGKATDVLIEPDYDLIIRKLKDYSIDLLIGGMQELPIAQSLGIDHVDIMHGSQKTVGFAGEENLAGLLCRNDPPERRPKR